MPRLPPEPQLDWSAEGAPHAAAFGDTYFSRDGGLAEAEAVFLKGCGLPEAWAGRSRFAIGELGFGAGLNALAVWRAWKQRRTPHAILHMCSVEAYLMCRADASRALAQFPEVEPLATKLLECWPVRAYGAQRLWFPDDGFALTIRIGDAREALAEMSGRFDAWFLDGFAPARNPAMWGDDVTRRVAALSAPGARLASFTVAGAVRRNLEAAGFQVEKKPGFGRKRERLEAIFLPPLAGEVDRAKRETMGEAAPSVIAQERADSSPVYGRATTFPLYPAQASHPKRVAIIGAGIAGAAVAHALAERDVEVVVLDASRALGAGASGNPVGLVAPRLDRDASGVSEVFLSAYLYAIATYGALDAFTTTGLEETSGASDVHVLEALLNDPPLPPEWLARHGDAIAFYPQAGVLKPDAAIAHFLRDARVLLEAPVASLEQSEGGWRLLAPDGRAQLKAHAVVIACGAALGDFEPLSFLPLHYSRGQIEWGAGPPLAHAKLGACYAVPFGHEVVFGATFDRAEPQAPVRATDASRQENLSALMRLDPDLAASIDTDALHSRAAIRVSTPDRAPVVGLLPDAPNWLAQNAGVAHGRPPPNLPAPALHGVYVIGALGARGLTLAPLLGEEIAAEMFGEPRLLSPRAQNAIHAARFLHRTLKKSVTMRDNQDGL